MLETIDSSYTIGNIDGQHITY